MIHIDELQNNLSGSVQINERLAPYTSLKLGGPAEIFVRPISKQEVEHTIKWAQSSHLPYFLLGYGTNILVADEGIKGVVISLSKSLNKMEITGNRVYAEAGISLPLLALNTIKHGLSGMEALGGIPGTLGGAIIMNAGAYGTEIFDVVEQVEIIRNGKITTLVREKVHYEYRNTDLQDDIILSVHFQLKKGDKEDLLTKRKEWLTKRRATQPLELPNAGSFFKNPPGYFAGQLIEETGLKGFRIGGVSVSSKHANFLVNDQKGSTADMLNLIHYVRKKVYQKKGIKLELEVKPIGFTEQAMEKIHELD